MRTARNNHNDNIDSINLIMPVPFCNGIGNITINSHSGIDTEMQSSRRDNSSQGIEQLFFENSFIHL